MFKLGFSNKMPDLSRNWLSVDCSKCNLETPVQLRDVINKKILICKGCKGNLILKDTYHSTKLGLGKINNMIKNIL